MTTDEIQEMRDQLASNRLREVLQTLQGQLAATDYQNAVLQLAAREAGLRRDLLAGTITDQDGRQRENQLLHDCLQLLDQLERGEPWTAARTEDPPAVSINKNVVGGDINNRDGTISIGDKQ